MEPRTDVVVRAARLSEVVQGDTEWTVGGPEGADWAAITHFRYQREGRTDWAEGFNVEFYTNEGSMTGSLGNGYDSVQEAAEDAERAFGLELSAWLECCVPHAEHDQVPWARVKASRGRPMGNASRDLTSWESELLLNAVEVTFLVELRHGAGNLPTASIESYRLQLGNALVNLVTRGLVTVAAAPWIGDPRTPLTRDRLVEMLSSGTGWDPEQEKLILIEATDEGEQLFLTAGA